MQLAYSAWTAILRNQFSLKDTLDFLDQPLPEYANKIPSKPIPFNKEINLNTVSFRYRENSPLILDKLSLTIPKGSRVGFIGTTGAGKSTLLDILMGLLRPSSGTLEIDSQIITEANHRAWQMHIAHVPQTIYLADSTIEENIAFGIPRHEIDRERVKRVAEQAQIAMTIEDLPQGYETFVGERGTRLSGGQRQRIGIARALYKNADILIFDEATSALDTDTEIAVMESIKNLGSHYTVLMIAHRLSTVRRSDKVIYMDNGAIIAQGNFESIRSTVPNFDKQAKLLEL
jgi:ATP-binding cassette subfamily B protein